MMQSTRPEEAPATSRSARLARPALWALGVVFALAFAWSCEVGPTSPSDNGGGSTPSTTATSSTTSTSTTSTSTSSTTTTTNGGTTTTSTSTTTTTLGLISYANQVHPIWDAEGCTNCHVPGSTPLDLSGAPTDTCASLAARDSSNQNLIIIGGSAAGSQILEKPQGQVSHAGGSFSCFGGNGDVCYDTVLQWLQEGANGPGGTTCGG